MHIIHIDGNSVSGLPCHFDEITLRSERFLILCLQVVEFLRSRNVEVDVLKRFREEKVPLK